MSLSLVKAALTVSGVAVTVGQAFDPVRFTRCVCSTSYMGNQMAWSGFFAVLRCEQIVDVRDADLRGIAGIDGAAACAGAVEFRRGVVGVDDVFGLQPEAGEVRVEERRVGVGVQQPRNADAEILAPFHQRGAFFYRLRNEKPLRSWDGVGDDLDLAMAEDIACGNVDKVGIGGLDLVDIGLDVLHLVEIFHGALFAGGDDEPLFAHAQRDLGLARLKFQ